MVPYPSTRSLLSGNHRRRCDKVSDVDVEGDDETSTGGFVVVKEIGGLVVRIIYGYVEGDAERTGGFVVTTGIFVTTTGRLVMMITDGDLEGEQKQHQMEALLSQQQGALLS